MPGPKINLNLNTTPMKRYYTKQKYKDHKNFHYRGEIKMAGKETDTQECKECHKILPLTAFTAHTLRSDGAYYFRNICRQCNTVYEKDRREARKNAPPKPEHCQCCHKKTKKLEVDHIHGSTTFRGWLCTDCNTGIGKLGDDLPGVLQAAIYLENDKNKIIETLDKVYNEMFARTT